MKNLLIVALLFYNFTLDAKLFVFDQIKAVVLGKGIDIITFSDEFDKKNLEGNIVPFSRLVRNCIMVQQAADEKMPIEDDIADDFILNMQRKNKISQEEIQSLFGDLGRTFAEGKDLLCRSEILRRFEGQRFYSRLGVTEGMILEEYKQNPEHQEAWCKVRVAYVTFDSSMTKKSQKEALEKKLADKKSFDDFDWSQDFELLIQDLAQDKEFIGAMKSDSFEIIEGENAFELYYLVEKHDREVRSLEDSKAAIIDRLTRRNNEVLMQEYEKLVRKYYTVLLPV